MGNLKFILLTACTVIFILILGCRKEKIIEKEVLIQPELIVSADTILFNESEAKNLYLSTKPASETKFQIISSPAWVVLSHDSGTIKGNIHELQIRSNFAGMEAGIYVEKLEIMSTSGSNSVVLKGFSGEHELHNLPDSLVFNIFDKSKNIKLINEGNVDLDFTLEKEDDYIELPLKSGNVLAGMHKEIQINLNRDSLQSGSYFSNIYFTINGIKDTVALRIENYQEQKALLSTDVIDAEYSKSLDKLYFVSSSPMALNIFDPKDKSIEEISLNYTPTCISISTDGSEAVVGHDGRISYIDLTSQIVNKTINVPIYVFDMVFGNNGWAYAVPLDGTHVKVHCINLSDESYVEHSGYSIPNESKIKLHSSGNSIYLADNGVSPSDMDKLDITNDTAIYLYDSPYHGDYPINGDLWLSEDGKRIFTKGKSVFTSSVIEQQDMLYNGKITIEGSNSFQSIFCLDHSVNAANIYFLSSGGWNVPNLPYVYIHNSTNLVFKEKIALEKYLVEDGMGGGTLYNPEPYFVFSNSSGNSIYIITKAHQSGLMNEWGIESMEIQ